MQNETSERLKLSKRKIMQQWLERAQGEISATLHQNTLALRNSLEGFLDNIAEALSVSPAKSTEQTTFERELFFKYAKVHGESRAGMKNYTIESLIFEYHILRQTICDVLEEGGPLSAREREIITAITEQAVNDAAAQYARTLREIRERFTATLVHDLLNPIASAVMSAQLILRRPDDRESTMANARRIVDRLRHVSSMIDDVLDASVLSAGENLSLPFEECNLRELLQQVAHDFNAEQADRVRLDLEGNLLGHWNGGALRRLVDNLVGNALKYGSLDRPVTVMARASGPGVTLSVHNFGTAISPGDQSILFQQFRRAKGTSSKSGWGLGLLVAKGLTEAHGGEIRVESKPESGTTFTVTLPWDSRRRADAIPA